MSEQPSSRPTNVPLLILMVVLAFGFISYLRSDPQAITVTTRKLKIGSADRTFRLAEPVTKPDNARLPVLIALHGALDHVEELAQGTGLDDLALTQGCLVVYPQGHLQNWPPSIPAEDTTAVDAELAFFDGLCDHLISHDHADPHRIYVVGVSQGGAMMNLLVAKRSHRIAAGVCVCGWLPEPLDEAPLRTDNKCPLLFVVGEDDRQVPPDVVRKAMQAFEADGHPCRLRLIPSFGHGWPREHGIVADIWDFLKDAHLNAAGIPQSPEPHDGN